MPENNNFTSGFDLEPVSGVPEKEHKKVAKISVDLIQSELNNAKNLNTKILRISKEYRKELRSIIGDQNIKNYNGLHRKLRNRVNNVVLKAEPTFEGETEIRGARKKIIEESRNYLKTIDFNTNLAKRARDKHKKELQDAIRDTIKRPEKPNYLVLPEKVPKDIHNPWEIYQPPYPGWSWSYWWGVSDEPRYPIYSRYLNAAAGQIGTYTSNYVSGADNSDYSYVRYRTAVRFWYKIPVAGMVNCWVRMQSIDTRHSGWFDDEWGWSDATCDQESKAYLRVINPGPGALRYATILDYRRSGTDASWNGTLLYPGYERWAHVYSSDSYPSNTWLLLEFGTEDWNHFWCNDVSVGSYMTMRWFLKNIYLRSSGE